MANKLKKLTVEEGSLVDKGANSEAAVVLFKREDVDKAGKKISGARTSVLKEVMEQINNAFQRMSNLLLDVEQPTTKGDDSMSEDTKVEEITEDTAKAEDSELADRDEQIKELKEKVAELTAKLKELSTTDEEPMEASAAESDEVRKHISTLLERVEKAEANAEAETNARLEREYDDKAKAFANIESENLAKVLRAADEAGVGEELNSILKSVDSRIAGNDVITRELGSGAVTESDADSKLDELAKARAAKNDESFEQAYTAVLKTDEGMRLYTERSEV